MDNCPVHQQPWKTVPAGVSKSTGKPYNAFQACSVMGCKEKPAKTNGTWQRPAGLPPKVDEWESTTRGYVPPPPPEPPILQAPKEADGFTRGDIDRGLRELPSKIARKAEVFNECLEALDNARRNLKIAEAKALTTLSNEELTVDEKKAQVVQMTEEESAEVITAESEMRIAKIKFEELRDSFDSVRKAANILVAEMGAFNDSKAGFA